MNTRKNLSLSWPVKACALAALLSAFTLPAPSDAAEPSGQYFGTYKKTMNNPTMFAGRFIVTPENVPYTVLGWSYNDPYWLWDFDKKTITLGGSSLRALEAMYPQYRLFSPTRQRIEGEHAPAILTTPEDVQREVIGTFERNADGTYTVSFNLQIFLEFAGFPLALVKSTMKIVEDGNGDLQISTLDLAPAGVATPDGKTLDGIPGVVRPGISEDPANGIFPFRVSPEHTSARMRKIDYSKDSNGDGIPDVVAQALGLNPLVADTDGDGIPDVQEIGPNWAQPIDSDRDGVPDALEPGNAAQDYSVLGNVRLANRELVTLTALNGEYFGQPLYNLPVGTSGGHEIEPRWLGLPDKWLNEGNETGANLLPKQDAAGKPYYYNLGLLSYRLTSFNTDYDAIKFIVDMLQGIDSARTTLASAQSRVDTAQAKYDNDPTEANLTALNTQKATLQTRQNTLAERLSMREKYLPARLERARAMLGSEIDTSMDDANQFLALLSSKNIQVDQLSDVPELEIKFAQGIPEGLKLFYLYEGYTANDASITNPRVYEHPYGRTELYSMSTVWAPQSEEVEYEKKDDQTIVARAHRLGVMDNVSVSNESGYANTLNAFEYQIAFAHTQTDRSAGPGDNQDTQPGDGDAQQPGDVATPAPGKHGGGGSFGWTSALGLLSLAAWRRRGKRRHEV